MKIEDLNDAFEVVVTSEDDMTALLKGHQYLEASLDIALTEFLPAPHTIELRRLSFGLKVDLLCALHRLNEKDAPAFHFVNALRNRFAHRHDASITDKDAADYRSLFLGPLADVFTDMKQIVPQFTGHRQFVGGWSYCSIVSFAR